jgi:hypothetical protein
MIWIRFVAGGYNDVGRPGNSSAPANRKSPRSFPPLTLSDMIGTCTAAT